MISIQIQYILVFVILGGVIGWVIYKIIKKEDKQSPCCGCGIAKSCGKKDVVSRCGDGTVKSRIKK